MNKKVVLTSYSQPHVLQHRMMEASLTHGQTVKADIGPVRIEENFGQLTMYFCPVQCIEIKEQITAGDNGGIPPEATLKGFENMHSKDCFIPGLFNLKNVTLFSNGTMQVIAGEDTVIEEVTGTRTLRQFPDTKDSWRAEIKRLEKEFISLNPESREYRAVERDLGYAIRRYREITTRFERILDRCI